MHQEEYQPPKRPTIITILTVLGGMSALLAFGLWRYDPFSTFTKLNATLAIINLFGLVGYWQMRRWGVFFCFMATMISIFYTMATAQVQGWQAYTGAAGYALATVIGLYYLREME